MNGAMSRFLRVTRLSPGAPSDRVLTADSGGVDHVSAAGARARRRPGHHRPPRVPPRPSLCAWRLPECSNRPRGAFPRARARVTSGCSGWARPVLLPGSSGPGPVHFRARGLRLRRPATRRPAAVVPRPAASSPGSAGLAHGAALGAPPATNLPTPPTRRSPPAPRPGSEAAPGNRHRPPSPQPSGQPLELFARRLERTSRVPFRHRPPGSASAENGPADVASSST